MSSWMCPFIISKFHIFRVEFNSDDKPVISESKFRFKIWIFDKTDGTVSLSIILRIGKLNRNDLVEDKMNHVSIIQPVTRFNYMRKFRFGSTFCTSH